MYRIECWKNGFLLRGISAQQKTYLGREKNIYYLLSLIHYLLSKVPRLCKWFLSVRSAGGYFCQSSQNEALKVRIIWGLLRRIFTVTALKMLAMEQPLLCFFPCHSKNTTQNSLINPNFQRLPKKTFSVRRTWSPKSDFAGEKSDFVSGAATHKMVLSPVFRNTNPLQC